jgi:thioredoxin-like negative regulator of GroEL
MMNALSCNRASSAAPFKSLLQHLQEDVPVDTLRLLTQTALLAVSRDFIDEANAISDGLQPSFGECVAVAMAHATVASADGRSADALDLLKRLCARYPRVSALKCALAMLKRELDLPGWRALAEDVAADDSDVQAREAARAMLRASIIQ